MGTLLNEYFSNKAAARKQQADGYVQDLKEDEALLKASFAKAGGRLGCGYIDLAMYLERTFPENQRVFKEIDRLFPNGIVELRGEAGGGQPRVWTQPPTVARRLVASALDELARFRRHWYDPYRILG